MYPCGLGIKRLKSILQRIISAFAGETAEAVLAIARLAFPRDQNLSFLQPAPNPASEHVPVSLRISSFFDTKLCEKFPRGPKA